MTLAEFLLARIAEDETAARGQIELRERRYPGETYEDDGSTYWVERGPWLYADPVRVLAECEAKRRIVEWEQRSLDLGRITDSSHSPILIFLALPYADHPDYDEAWRP